MIDIAMHIMDLAQNSIRANARSVNLTFDEKTDENRLYIYLNDDGDGMDESSLKRAQEPFFTSRTTRRVGLGIPMIKMTAEQTNGYCRLQSEKGKGTRLEIMFCTDNVDCLPLGDLPAYLSLILSANPELQFTFAYKIDENRFEFSTDELKQAGIDDFSNPGMRQSIKEFLKENLNDLFRFRKKNSHLC
jgi:hypothetical protein